MESINEVKRIFSDSIEAKKKILADNAALEKIARTAQVMVESYRNGGRTFFAGNGGSAADAQHLAGELVSKFFLERDGLASEALNCNTSIITAIGNDYSYDRIFARQLEANAKKGDVFVGLSTSGNSKNVIAAIETCRKMGVLTVGMTGEGGGKMADICDILIDVPSKITPRVQESHITIGHIICEIVEAELFGGGK